ncbi:hypothetical protein Slin14017_G114570 [Septoria linicola]|nr:hypothetical protein Slin14017_G114570 [Septoria linicola]
MKPLHLTHENICEKGDLILAFRYRVTNQKNLVLETFDYTRIKTQWPFNRKRRRERTSLELTENKEAKEPLQRDGSGLHEVRVDSRILELVSTVFEVMLSDKFSEGQNTRTPAAPARINTIELDNALELRGYSDLLHMLHYKNVENFLSEGRDKKPFRYHEGMEEDRLPSCGPDTTRLRTLADLVKMRQRVAAMRAPLESILYKAWDQNDLLVYAEHACDLMEVAYFIDSPATFKIWSRELVRRNCTMARNLLSELADQSKESFEGFAVPYEMYQQLYQNWREGAQFATVGLMKVTRKNYASDESRAEFRRHLLENHFRFDVKMYNGSWTVEPPSTSRKGQPLCGDNKLWTTSRGRSWLDARELAVMRRRATHTGEHRKRKQRLDKRREILSSREGLESDISGSLH